MPHPVRQMRLRKQRREQTEEHSSAQTSTHSTVNEVPAVPVGQPITSVAHPALAAEPSAAEGVVAQGHSVRLHKIMADHGLGSRRGLEEAIRDGKISVNGKVAEIGQTVQPGDVVHFEGRVVRLHFGSPTFPRVLMYHKPAGEIVSRDDPQERADVFERLPALEHGRWISIGRLDFNSEGLLLFTDSGELAHRLMHPRHDIEREYAVRVFGTLTGEQCRKLLQGVQLEDGLARIISLRDQGGEGANHWYHVVLKDGRYREVRRIFAALELTVSRLIRVRYANLPMPSHLKRGHLEELNVDLVTRLMRVVSMFPADFSAQTAGKVVPFEGQRPEYRDRNDRNNDRNTNRNNDRRDAHPRTDRYGKPSPYGDRQPRQYDDKAPASPRYDDRNKRPPYQSRPDRPDRPVGGDRAAMPSDTRSNDGYRDHRGGSRDGRAAGERYPSKPRGDRPFVPNPPAPGAAPVDEDQNQNLNLKGGGGRHPFKRYSQRRVMSHQQRGEEGGYETPQTPYQQPARAPYPSQSHQKPTYPTAPVYPDAVAVAPAPVVAPKSQVVLDEDALLQQRYAERERRGELKGLAGQTLGGEAHKHELDGNRRPPYGGGGQGFKNNGYSRPPSNGGTREGGWGDRPRPAGDANRSRYPRRPDQYGQTGGGGSYPRAGGEYSFSRSPATTPDSRGHYDAKNGYGGGGRDSHFHDRGRPERDQQPKGDGTGYPRPFQKKVFKKKD